MRALSLACAQQGRSEDGWLKSCEAYDVKADTWHALPPMKHARNAHAMCAHDSTLFVLGGSDGFRSCAVVETFDVRARVWGELVERLERPPRNATALVLEHA